MFTAGCGVCYPNVAENDVTKKITLSITYKYVTMTILKQQNIHAAFMCAEYRNKQLFVISY